MFELCEASRRDRARRARVGITAHERGPIGFHGAAGGDVRDGVGDRAERDRAASQRAHGRPKARVALVGGARDGDDGRPGREQGIEQAVVHRLVLEVDHHQRRRARAGQPSGERRIAKGLEADRVVAALDQLGAQRRARPALGADHPDRQSVAASPCITDARMARRPSGSRRIT